MTMDITRLVESIRNNGWDGPAIIVDGGLDDILDGNHRYAAAKSLGWSDDEIPTVDIRDLFSAARLDYDAIIGDATHDADAQMLAISMLPTEVMDEYGLFDGN